jgi:O-acetyl-ADP-ribose deacetylase (regulator of RNase III)
VTTVVRINQSYDVYIGRPSKWGNPFRIGPDGNRKEVIEKYRAWIAEQPELLKSLPELKGKRLGCYCKPLACHGDVLADLIEREKPVKPAILEESHSHEQEASFICPRCTGAGCVGNNRRVETCDDCGGEGRFRATNDLPTDVPRKDGVRLVTRGSLFNSKAQTLVNAVNCVGVMGNGIAREFKNRFPEMYRDYVARCQRGDVLLGAPYLYKPASEPWILNFPTKHHWRDRSSLETIAAGLGYLARHYEAWGIKSMAFPALGCGLGQLSWGEVGPLISRIIAPLKISADLYAPWQPARTQPPFKGLERE